MLTPWVFCQKWRCTGASVIQAEDVCAVTDGVDWGPRFFDLQRITALRILDFPHAAKHLSALHEALEKIGHHFPTQMLERCLHVLKHRGPRPLLRMSQRLSSDVLELASVREHFGYLRKREGLKQYPQFRRQGWPIGSGMVWEWGECRHPGRRSTSDQGRDAISNAVMCIHCSRYAMASVISEGLVVLVRLFSRVRSYFARLLLSFLSE